MTKMDWSGDQRNALACIERFRTEAIRGSVCRVFGFAGTGKTTLIQELAADCKRRWVSTPWGDELRSSIVVAAYTGKAAQVLRRKGVVQASTIHSTIYRSVKQSREQLQALIAERARENAQEEPNRGKLHELDRMIAELKEKLRQPQFMRNDYAFIFGEPEMIIVDEVSMVDRTVGSDLEWFGIPLLVFGDTMQLTPIDGPSYFMRDAADVLMTQIHRQAKDNPIIQLATTVREGRKLARGKWGVTEVTQKFPTEWWREYDQLLVGRNAEREARNRHARKGLGFKSPLPEIGDKLVCWRNNHELGLLNGSLWRVENVAVDPSGKKLPRDLVKLDLLSVDIADVRVSTLAWQEIFLRGYKAFDDQHWDYEARLRADEFDFAYALTVHKAQGSEWDRVLLLDESHCWKQDGTAANWLYTGITRASQQLTVVSQ